MQNSSNITDYSRVTDVAGFKTHLREQYDNDTKADEEEIPWDEIVEIAHRCRQDYIRSVEESDPAEYLKGCAGADRHLSELIELEAEYEKRANQRS